MGKSNSVKGSVLVKNPDVYFVGCPCHMTHNAAFLEASVSSGFNVEDLVVDIYFYITGLTKVQSV